MMPQVTPEYLENERNRTVTRIQTCMVVGRQLQQSIELLTTAQQASPLDAIKMIAQALALFMQTQKDQLDMNEKENQEMLVKLDRALAEMRSPIRRPGRA